MRARSISVLFALVLTGVAVAIAPPPAGASVTPTVSGTTITVTMTGDGFAGFGCGSGNNVTLDGTLVAPAIACSALTKVTVNGDSGRQQVFGYGLDGPAFTAGPILVATLGAGNDSLWDTARADAINLGDGTDVLQVNSAVPNTSANLGNDPDFVAVLGTDQAETFTVTSGSATVAVARSTGGSPVTNTVVNAEYLSIYAAGGNDTLVSTAITVPSSIDDITLYGEAGNDTLTSGAVFSHLNGGTGTNVMTSGGSEDYFESESDTDVIHDGGGQTWIQDQRSPRSGNRTLDVHGATGTWVPYQTNGDAVLRLRPSTAPGTWVTATLSLTRPGQQVLPTNINNISANQSNDTAVPDRSLVDIVVGQGDYVGASGDGEHDDIADITIPTGEVWHTTGTPATTYSITPENADLMNVNLLSFGEVSIHHPWTDKDQGFVHRMTRDLLFRFPTEAQVDTLGGQLTAGTKTRPQLTTAAMATDEYRGLDVDRVYVKYLRRKADPGGRTSWVSALRNGKPLWRFRAQLIGSNEYFTKAGATNAAYMVQAYNDVMGRLPDPSGQAYWTNKLDHGANRGSVALQFLASTEARRNVAKDQFLRFLDRLPTTSEANAWIATLGSSPTGEQDLIAFLANSGTYFNRS